MTYGERIEKFIECYNLTGSKLQASLLVPDIVDDSYFERGKPKLGVYVCQEYSRQVRRSFPEIDERLNSLAKQNVSKSPIFTYRKRFIEYCNENRPKVKEEFLKELEEIEKQAEEEFNQEEKRRKIEMDRLYQEKYEEELQMYNLQFHPTEEYIEQEYDLSMKCIKDKIWQNGFSIRFGSAVQLEHDVTGKSWYTCSISVDSLEQFVEYSFYKWGATATGKITQRKKTSKELEEEYAQNIAAVAFICAACLFNITSDAEKLLVTCHTEYIDEATGNEKTGYLYSVIIPRNLMKTFKMENLNTVSALLSLEGNVDIRKGRDIYFINPLEWNFNSDIESSDKEVEDYNDDEDYGENDEIFIDFRRLNVNLPIPDQYKDVFDEVSSRMTLLKGKIKDIVANLEVFEDDFDDDTYAEGACKFMCVAMLLKRSEEMFFSKSSDYIREAFGMFFGSNSYAMGEIQELCDNNIFARIEKGEKVPLDTISNQLLSSSLRSDD